MRLLLILLSLVTFALCSAQEHSDATSAPATTPATAVLPLPADIEWAAPWLGAGDALLVADSEGDVRLLSADGRWIGDPMHAERGIRLAGMRGAIAYALDRTFLYRFEVDGATDARSGSTQPAGLHDWRTAWRRGAPIRAAISHMDPEFLPKLEAACVTSTGAIWLAAADGTVAVLDGGSGEPIAVASTDFTPPICWIESVSGPMLLAERQAASALFEFETFGDTIQWRAQPIGGGRPIRLLRDGPDLIVIQAHGARRLRAGEWQDIPLPGNVSPRASGVALVRATGDEHSARLLIAAETRVGWVDLRDGAADSIELPSALHSPILLAGRAGCILLAETTVGWLDLDRREVQIWSAPAADAVVRVQAPEEQLAWMERVRGNWRLRRVSRGQPELLREILLPQVAAPREAFLTARGVTVIQRREIVWQRLDP